MDFIDLKSQYALIKDDVNKRINTVLSHGQYILGPEVNELEEALQSFTGTNYCIAMSSGTDALLAALMALDIGVGDEVITTPFSFVANAEMITLLGAIPVFVDIEPDTYNINPELIEDALTTKTKAILAVSLYGQCADFEKINQIATRHNLPVIEDAAQSFGATYKGQPSCSLTTIACTSFFPSKPLGCYGDGGACFTSDESLASKIKQIRTHGQESRYKHIRVGLNGRIDTIQAAVLLAKLEIFPREIQLRNQVGDRYSKLISEKRLPIRSPMIKKDNMSVFAQYTVAHDSRESIISHLNSINIPTAVHYPVPIHKQAAYAGNCVIKNNLFHSEQAAERVCSLPMHPYLAEKDQVQIVDELSRFYDPQ